MLCGKYFIQNIVVKIKGWTENIKKNIINVVKGKNARK